MKSLNLANADSLPAVLNWVVSSRFLYSPLNFVAVVVLVDLLRFGSEAILAEIAEHTD